LHVILHFFHPKLCTTFQFLLCYSAAMEE